MGAKTPATPSGLCVLVSKGEHVSLSLDGRSLGRIYVSRVRGAQGGKAGARLVFDMPSDVRIQRSGRKVNG